MKKYVIYKIVSNNIEVKHAYVGHTKNFDVRKRAHKSDSQREIKAQMKIYKFINEHGGWACWTMVKIETCLCESKDEARELEQKYYKELNESLNTNRPMRTPEELKEDKAKYNKQYKIDNKIAIKEQNKQYRNKDKIKQYHEQNKEKMKEYQLGLPCSILVSRKACSMYFQSVLINIVLTLISGLNLRRSHWNVFNLQA